MKYLFCFALCLTLVPFRLVAEIGDENWETFPIPKGLNGTVLTLLSTADRLYAGGEFTEADGQPAGGLAAWDGLHWSPLMAGLEGSVLSFATDGKNLYVGGHFIISQIGATNLAMWNGRGWKNIGSAWKRDADCFPVASVYALTWHDHKLFVGGTFDMAGGVAATNIAVFDGESWQTLDSGVGGSCDDNGFGIVYCIEPSGRQIYAGGLFHHAGSTVATNIALWDGKKWTSLGSGLEAGSFERINYEGGEPVLYSGAVYDIRFRRNELIAAGDFRRAGATVARGLAKWDGDDWVEIGDGVRFADNRYAGSIYKVAVDGPDLIVAGSFDRAGTVIASNVARWDGRSWSAFGGGLSAEALAVGEWRRELFVGGDFGVAGDQQAPFVARWSKIGWRALHEGAGQGVFGWVTGIAASPERLYAVGQLTSAGGQRVQNLAEWDGTRWSDLGEGFLGNPWSAAVLKSNLYVLGAFEIPGIGATNIARWDGQRWNSIPIPTISRPYSLGPALVADDDNLYSNAWGDDASVFSWDGSRWSKIGESFWFDLFPINGERVIVPGSVYYLATQNGRLAAVGNFNRIGSQTAANGAFFGGVALWDGTVWSLLEGFPPPLSPIMSLYSPAFVGDDLYVVVYDGQAQSTSLMRWNGAWSRVLTLGIGQSIARLASSGRNLYVSGSFAQIGGVTARNIARFDGTNWFPLGSGLDAPADPITVLGDRLICGGNFTRAGGRSSYHLAIWHEPDL